MKVTCPNCNTNHKIRLVDNEPLFMQQQTNPKEYFPIDSEVYLFFHCDECDNQFRQTFDLVPKEQPKVPTQTVSCPKCGEDTEKPMGLLVQPDTYGEVNCTCGHVYYYPLKSRVRREAAIDYDERS